MKNAAKKTAATPPADAWRAAGLLVKRAAGGKPSAKDLGWEPGVTTWHSRRTLQDHAPIDVHQNWLVVPKGVKSGSIPIMYSPPTTAEDIATKLRAMGRDPAAINEAVRRMTGGRLGVGYALTPAESAAAAEEWDELQLSALQQADEAEMLNHSIANPEPYKPPVRNRLAALMSGAKDKALRAAPVAGGAAGGAALGALAAPKGRRGRYMVGGGVLGGLAGLVYNAYRDGAFAAPPPPVA